MFIKLEIEDESFKKFEKKINQVDLDIEETLLIIFTQCLKKKDIVLNNISLNISDNETTNLNNFSNSKSSDIFLYIEDKMKKYEIYQSSLAECLNATQASISRSLKNRNENSKLYKEAIAKKDKLLVCAYLNQYKVEINTNEISCNIPKNTLKFFESILYKVKEEYLHTFSFYVFEENLCSFIKSDIFNEINFDELYNDIDLLVETIEEITNNYFL